MITSSFRNAMAIGLVISLTQPALGQSPGTKGASPGVSQPSAPTLAPQPPVGTNFEAEKIDIEKKRLALEELRLDVEKHKDQWTSFAIVLPIIVGIITIGVTVWSQIRQRSLQLDVQREQAKSQFLLKAAEIIMEAPGSYEYLQRARALRDLFPSLLPEDLLGRFDPAKYGLHAGKLDAKREFLRLLIEAGLNDYQKFIDAWIQLFPTDEWANKLNLTPAEGVA